MESSQPQPTGHALLSPTYFKAGGTWVQIQASCDFVHVRKIAQPHVPLVFKAASWECCDD